MLIAVGATLWGMATAASGLAMTYGQLALARLSIGVGEATLSPAAYSLIAEQFPPKRLSLALSVYMLGVTFGGGLALAASGVLIDTAGDIIRASGPLLARFQDWQVVFFLVGAPTLLLTPLIFTIRDIRPPKAERPAIVPGAGMAFWKARWKVITPFFIAFGLTSIAVNGVIAWIPSYMARRFDISMGEVGLGFGLVTFVTTGVGQITWSVVVDWLYARGMRDAHTRFHMFCWLVSTPAVICSAMVGTSWAFLGLMGLFLLFTYVFQGYAGAGLQLMTPPAFRGRMSAAFLAWTSLTGLTLGPTSVAFLTEHVFHDRAMVGWSMVVLVMVCAPLGMISLWVAGRQRRALERDTAALGLGLT